MFDALKTRNRDKAPNRNIEMGQCPVKLYNEQLLHLIECGRMIK